MPSRSTGLVLSIIAFVLTTLTTFADEPKKAEAPSYDPLSSYDQFERQGFKIMVSRRVVKVGEVLKSLDQRLKEITEFAPSGFEKSLRETPIWIEPGGFDPGEDQDPSVKPRRHWDVQYFPILDRSRVPQWLLPEKIGSIEVLSLGTLEEPGAAWRTKWAGGWLWHEFAHAMHDQILGLDNPAPKTAYAQAMEHNLYAEVELNEYAAKLGLLRKGPAYALKNHLEYFAEISTAYFGQSKLYYPHTRGELRRHDPKGFELMESFWQSSQFRLRNEMPCPLALYWVGENSRRHKLFDLMPKQERTFDGWSRLNLVGENMLSGDEYRFDRPKAGESVWRLTAESAVKK
jgi:dipeptidyl-peptidase-4